MIKLTKTSIVKNILSGYPSLSAIEVARRAKCDASTVYQIKSKMKSDLAKMKGMKDGDVIVGPAVTLLAKSVVDMVNNPPHYTVGGIETIDFIQAKLTVAEYKGFLKGTILAYASRIGHKDGTDDAGKIGWYAKKLQEL